MEAILQLKPCLDIKSISYLSPKPIIFHHQKILPLTTRRVTIYSSTKRVDGSKSFTLDSMRNTLINQNDTIILNLLERAKYSHNPHPYDKDAFVSDDFKGSLVEYRLLETEKLDAKMGRYNNPEEHPFFPEDLPKPIMPPNPQPQFLHQRADSININKKIWKIYVKDILPKLVKEGNDDEWGSIAACDILCLQALSKRIHYGKFVAEAKYQKKPLIYDKAIEEKDKDKLSELLKDDAIDNVANPTIMFDSRVLTKFFNFFEDYVKPLTTEEEVEYLLRKLD